jgi:hypothetical protein
MGERVPYKHKVAVRFCHLLYSLCNNVYFLNENLSLVFSLGYLKDLVTTPH